MNTVKALLLTALLWNVQANACTTFLVTCEGEAAVGKSYDWNDRTAMIVFNKRGLDKTALIFSDQEPARWASTYSSLTFNQYGREFPTGGMNEAGLVVEVMLLPQTQYPGSEDEAPAVNPLQWIQMILDTAGSVDDAVDIARKSKIIPLLDDHVHYLVCGRQNCATFEYLDGALEIHQGGKNGETVNALTNDTYAHSAKVLQMYKGFGGDREVPAASTGSLQRFAIASQAARDCGADIKEHVFNTLDRVKMAGLTKWQIAYEPSKGFVSYRTDNNPYIRVLDFKKLNKGIQGACAQPAQLLDMNGRNHSDDMTGRFTDYDSATAQEILAGNSVYGTHPELLEAALAYPKSTTCQSR